MVNNAGYSLMGQFTTTSWEDHQRFLNLMALAPIDLSHRLLPAMLDAGFGRIVNVTSVAGYLSGTPNMALYCAAKSFVIKFTEGLAPEIRSAGVNCLASVPGFTDTEIFGSIGVKGHVGKNPVMRAALMAPETVAQQAYDACERGEVVTVHGWHHRAWVSALLHSPKPLRYKLSAFSGNIRVEP